MAQTPDQIADLIDQAITSKAAIIEEARKIIVATKIEAESAREAANTARARVEAEVEQVKKILEASANVRTAIEQERDKANAALASIAAILANLEESKNRAAGAASEIQVELGKAKDASTASVINKQATDQAKGAAESARLATEAERDKAAEAARSAIDHRTSAQSLAEATNNHKNAAEAAKNSAQAAQSHSEAARDSATRARESAERDLASIQETHSKADSLYEAIVARQKEIDSFKKVAEGAAFDAERSAAESMDATKKAIAEASRAAEAHNLSTTAGLAGAFNQKAKSSLLRELLSLFTLVISLGGIVGIAIWRYPDLRVLFNNTPSIEALVLEILLSMFGVGGLVWLAWIATRMLSRNHAVSEDYSYKAALAQAYVGFRNEAKGLNDPLFEQRLFAAAITQLDSNPVRLLGFFHPGSPLQDLLQQPFMQDLLKNEAFKASLVGWLTSHFGGRGQSLRRAENASSESLGRVAQSPNQVSSPPPLS
jgi:chemotaxis protein histidine kinase CheA